MHRQAHRVERLEAVAREKSFDRAEAVERQMLMIERVPLQAVAQISGVHDLERENSVGLQAPRRCLKEIDDAPRSDPHDLSRVPP